MTDEDVDSEDRAEPPPVPLEALADAMPQLVWTASSEGVVDYYNARVDDYGGRVREGAGYDWHPLIHPDDLEPTEREWRAASEAGSSYEFRHRIMMADGSYRWHLSRALPVQLDSGEVKWFGTATDVHTQTLAEERASGAADVLQRALLPAALPAVPGFDLASRYRPGTSGDEVGGDWFDVIWDGSVLSLVIGDVAGHGIDAAAAMGAARHAVASSTLAGFAPAASLDLANRYLLGLDIPMTTCVIVRMVDLGRSCRLCVAGHPPPVISADGKARLPTYEVGPPLGAFDGAEYVETPLPPLAGASIILYTDGLVERRSSPIDVQLASLIAELSGPFSTAEEICEALMARFADDARDDVALLAARVPG